MSQLHPKVETEWISALKKMGIIEKTDKLEQEQPEAVDQSNTNDDDLFAELDEDDEIAFEQYRRRRLLDLQIESAKRTYGEVLEITKQNYVEEVNQAGEGVWVVLHVYKTGDMFCSLLNQFMSTLAHKFRQTKFLKSIVDLCIPNFPEQNLPAIFVYRDGQMVKQLLGAAKIGDLNMKCEDLEWILSQIGAIESNLEEDPRKNRAKSNRYVMSINDSDED